MHFRYLFTLLSKTNCYDSDNLGEIVIEVE